jgi:hypothetical protein
MIFGLEGVREPLNSPKDTTDAGFLPDFKAEDDAPIEMFLLSQFDL